MPVDIYCVNENPAIVAGFKRGFADAQKRAREMAITVRQKKRRNSKDIKANRKVKRNNNEKVEQG